MAEKAVVTRADRLAAFRALDHDGRTEEPHPDSAIGRWLDGKADAVTYQFMLADSRVAQAIADARTESAAEVTRLQGEVDRLERQLKTAWVQLMDKAPTVASAELEADLDAVRKALPVSGKRWATSRDALDRIAAALGVKEPT